jgi:polyisoprenyl-phosphate glycosyltransferase
MIHYTVLIPQRDSIDAVRDLVPRLCRVFESLLLPYEIICIDDGSTGSAWEELLFEFAPLRVLHFDSARGTSAALTAGIAAARGDLILTISPQTRLSVDKIPQLIARLSQNDLVVARPEQSFGSQLRSALSKLSRFLVG